MSDETRRRQRRRLLLAGLAPLLLALLFASKVGAMTVHDRDGRASYRSGDFGSARSAFAENSTLNYLQTWVSPYDEGTTRYRLEDFEGAIRSLEDALVVVPADRECLVRINLALAHEAVGDGAATAKDAGSSAEAWRKGVEVLSEGRCLDPAGAAEAQAADARAVDERLRAKSKEQESPTPDQPPDQPEPQEEAQADELDDRTERAERQRRKAEQRRQDREDAEQKPDEEAPTYEW